MTFEKAYKKLRDLFQKKAEEGVFSEKEIRDFNDATKVIVNYYNKKEGGNKEVQMPWTEKDFLEMWEYWKTYKKEEFKFTYKSVISEQAALNRLSKLSDGDKDIAIAIIKQSMANSWKGFFELKQKQGKNNQNLNNYKSSVAQRLLGNEQ
jgi:uncharacterized protein YihD (DUF1040 family)